MINEFDQCLAEFELVKKKLYRALALLVLVILPAVVMTGCGLTPQREVVETKQAKIIVTPKNLLKPCKVTAPPAPQEYIGLTYRAKEEVLTNYGISLLRDLEVCNEQIKQIEDFQTKQAQAIDKAYKDLK